MIDISLYFDPLLQEAKAFINLVRAQFTDPDADWLPAVCFLTIDQDGKPRPEVLPIPPCMMNNRQSKEVLAGVISRAAVKYRAIGALQIFEGWLCRGASLEEQFELPPPSQRPDRKEVLMIVEVRGDLGSRLHTADILRFPDRPPELSEWITSDFAGGEAGGMFVDELSPLVQGAFALANSAFNSAFSTENG